MKHFMTRPATTSLALHLFLIYRKFFDKSVYMLSFWTKIFNHFRETYEIDDVTAEMKIRVQNFKRPSNMTPKQRSKTLWTETLSWNQVYT